MKDFEKDFKRIKICINLLIETLKKDLEPLTKKDIISILEEIVEI